MKKEELIENLENYSSYYQRSIIFNLCLKLIKGTDENDPDFKEVLDDETGEQIVDLFVDCYDEKDFLEFLNKNDFDLFNNYRYSDRVYRSDYSSDQDFKENSGAYYGDDIGCLLYNEATGCYVKSW